MKNNIGRLTSARQSVIAESVKFGGSEVGVLNSLQIAEMVGRKHKNVIRDIDKYIEHFKSHGSSLSGENIDIGKFFIDGFYTNERGRKYKMYYLTKMGCELYATRMTGADGTLFAAKYVEVFNELEEREIRRALNTTYKNEEKLQLYESKLIEMKTEFERYLAELPILNHQQAAIEKARKKVVMKALGGKSSNAYKELSRKVFSEIGRDFKNHFNVPRYNELPQSRYEEGLTYISRWRPSTNTQVLIDEANGQMVLWGGEDE